MTETANNWDKAPEVASQTVSYFMRGMRVFWELIAPERSRILAAVGILVVIECLSLGTPLLFKELVDYLPEVMRQGITPFVIGVMAAMFALRAATISLRRFVQEPIFVRAITRLENLWPTIAQEKLLALSAGYHERENTGRKIAKVTKGVEKLVGMLADLFWSFVPAFIYLVINGVVILLLDWKLGLLFMLPLIPAVWINLKSYEVFYADWGEWERQKEESVGLFCQSVINVRTVQSFVSEVREAMRHSTIRTSMRNLDLDIFLRIQKYYFAMEMVLGISFVFTILAGLYFVYQGWSTVGTVAYVFITGNTTLQNLWGMIQIYTRVLRHLVAAERMQELLMEDVDVRNDAMGRIPPAGTGAMVFEDVSLVYASKEESAIRNFTLTIAPGEMLAFVGRSGSGKSTLANLLVRAYDPTGGRITVDGIDIRNVDRDWYRRRFALVPQEVEIFDGTIRENIVYAYPDAGVAVIEKAVKAACLDEVVHDKGRFPRALATPVGERGVRLSGGEKQRVGIARAYVALLCGASMLVLDEATSSLDSQSERVVQEFVERLRNERAITIVAIAHRLSTIQKADRICVLDAGRIIEMGDHRRLLEEGGLYKKLVTLQQLGEIRE